MQTLIIEPHDSFIARDGRPFDATPGVRAASLPFPFPSTTTGGVRTRAGLDGQGAFDAGKVEEVKGYSSRGPLLVELDHDGGAARWLAHAPADALLLDAAVGGAPCAAVRRLVTQQPLAGAQTDLPPGLLPLYLPKDSAGVYDKRKPHGYAPRFWFWERFESWLRALPPSESDDSGEIELARLGHDGPPQEVRSHVSIRPDTQTHEEGQLFQTRGREFTRQAARRVDGTYVLGTALRLALAVATDAPNLNPGVASLGGERRLISWRRFRTARGDGDHTGGGDLFASQCPDDIASRIVADGACRVVMLTPAHFRQGWRPSWMTEADGLLKEVDGGRPDGLSVELKSAAVGRPLVVSGWDFERRGPKPTRRLVPSGSVFFLRLRGEDARIRDWIERVWMQCVSDGDQDRRDGFGLAALGVWPEGTGVS